MKLKHIFLIIFCILILYFLIGLFIKQQTPVQTGQVIKQTAVETKNICYKQQCFSVEVAKTTVEMEKGLMFRENLDENNGMLFIFNNSGKYNFWMKNTLIPLDIIWINKNIEIVDIKENVPPCKQEPCEIYSPKTEAWYVLEVNGGSVKMNNISIGDKLNIS